MNKRRTMTRDDAKKQIRLNLRFYVEQITQRSKGKDKYVCPLCGSGTHSNGTGAFSIANDGETWKCFSCGDGGDIFDLIGKVEGLTGYTEQLQRAAVLTGIPLDTDTAWKHTETESVNWDVIPDDVIPDDALLTGTSQGRAEDAQASDNGYRASIPVKEETGSQDAQGRDGAEQDPAEVERIRRDIAEAQKHIAETDYHRGISLETLTQYGVGFLPNWKSPKHSDDPRVPETARLIVPTGAESYLARATDPRAPKKFQKQKAGKQPPIVYAENLRKDAPCFIAEGELDALSIIDAGGNAVSLGGASKADVRAAQIIKQIRPAHTVILYPDNDNPGKAAAKTLADEFDRAGISYYWLTAEHLAYGEDGTSKYKDPNEYYMANREAFQRVIQSAQNGVLEREKMTAENRAAGAVNAPERAQDAPQTHDEYIQAVTQEQAKKVRDEKERREKYAAETNAALMGTFLDGLKARQFEDTISTGIAELDRKLDGGLHPGTYFIGAMSAAGKTTLALQIADAVAAGGRDVLIVSLEMGRDELIARSISRLTYDISGRDAQLSKTTNGILRGGDFSHYPAEEREIIQKALEAYKKYAGRIHIIGCDDKRLTDKDIRDAVDYHKTMTGRSPVLIVDYLQIIAPDDPRKSDKQNVDDSVISLKGISRKHRTPVICLSSFNRAGYGENISMANFKESGSVEYTSDVLIGLETVMEKSDKGENTNMPKESGAEFDPERTVILKVLKNRNGRIGEIKFTYHAAFNTFSDVAPTYSDNPTRGERYTPEAESGRRSRKGANH